MKENVIDNVKKHFITSINLNLSELKDKMSSDILNFELGVLYSNKIYGEDSLNIQDVFSKLSDDIDYILNMHNQSCVNSIESLFNNVSLSKNVLKFVQRS